MAKNPVLVAGATGVAANAIATTATGAFTFTCFKRMHLRRLIAGGSSAAGGVLSGLMLTSLVIDGISYVGTGAGTGAGVPIETFFGNSVANPLFDVIVSKDSTITASVLNGSSVTQDCNLALIGYEV